MNEYLQQRVLEIMPDAVFVNQNDSIIYFNLAFARLLGLPNRKEILGKSPFCFFHQKYHDIIRRRIENVLTNDAMLPRIEEEIVDSYGNIIPVEVSAAQFLYNNQPSVLVILQDLRTRKQLEAALRESEERYRTLFNAITDPIFVYDLITLSCLAVNDATITQYGYERHELIGNKIINIKIVDDCLTLIEILSKNETKQQNKIVWQRKKNDGSIAYLNISTRYLDLAGRSVCSIQVIDITSKIENERAITATLSALEQSQRLQRIAGEKAKIGGWVVNIINNDIIWSDEVCAIHGMPSGYKPKMDEALNFYAPEYQTQIEQVVINCAKNGIPFDLELEIINSQGQRVSVRSIGEAVRNANGHIIQIQGAFQDITKGKKIENALRASEALFRTVIQSSWDVFHVVTKTGLIRYESPAVTRVLGYRPDEMEGKKASEFVHPDDIAKIEELLADAGSLGDTHTKTLRIRHKDGSWLWMELYIVNLVDHPDVLGFAVNYRDITTRKEAEDDRLRLQAALEKIATITSITSARIDSHFFEQLTINMAEILNAQAAFLSRLLPDQTGRARTIAAVVFNQLIENFDYTIDGTPCQFISHQNTYIIDSHASKFFENLNAFAFFTVQAYAGQRVDNSEGQPIAQICLLFSDPINSSQFITSTLQIFATRIAAALERQKADTQLHEQASLLDKAQDAIIVLDLSHHILYWNKSAARQYGWENSEIIGKSVKETLCYDVAETEAATATTLARGEWIGELRQRRKDGTLVTAESRWTLVHDDQGMPKSILAVNTDITERKKLEIIEEQFRQAQKMEAVGNLAGGVAHDFNNLLSVILSYTDLMLAHLRPLDPLHNDLREIRKAGIRATELTRQLLAFSRKQILQPVVLDLNQILTGIEKMLGRLLGEHIQISFLSGPNVGKIRVDSGQLEQIIINLAVNARDAMPDGGQLTIEIANTLLDENYASQHAGVNPGSYVMIAITDTGIGMDRITQSHIFEPFFTTKDKSKGTGLGLSTVYGIVQQSGGHIWVYSELDKGTCFKIYFPRSDDNSPELLPETEPPISLRGNETILIVEDEPQVRNILSLILRKHGYHVLEAQNGGEALLLCEQFTASIHLLLTDVVMPHISGRRLAERLAPLRPNMKVLFISGYTENTIVHHGVLDAGIEFLPKPIIPEALLKKVRMVLNSLETFKHR